MCSGILSVRQLALSHKNYCPPLTADNPCVPWAPTGKTYSEKLFGLFEDTVKGLGLACSLDNVRSLKSKHGMPKKDAMQTDIPLTRRPMFPSTFAGRGYNSEQMAGIPDTLKLQILCEAVCLHGVV